jgi:hypothetical protein
MVRPERFELPAFWFVAKFDPLHPTTPANQTQRNNKKRLLLFASLWPVSVALHGHFTDSLSLSPNRKARQGGLSRIEVI